MLLVPACKRVLFTYFCLFICLFLIFACAREQREARGDHLKTFDVAANMRSADKKI